MFRLILCCLVLGAALANLAPVEEPSRPPAARGAAALRWAKQRAPQREDTLRVVYLNSQLLQDKQRATREEAADPRVDLDPMPLPAPVTNTTALRSYSFYVLPPGYYALDSSIPSGGQYANNDYFLKVFTGSSGQYMSISCNPFDVEYHPTCDYDWLYISGVKYCGSGTILRYGYTLVVEFQTDATVTDTGFGCVIHV